MENMGPFQCGIALYLLWMYWTFLLCINLFIGISYVPDSKTPNILGVHLLISNICLFNQIKLHRVNVRPD